MNYQTNLPDIAAQRSANSAAALDWVGMRGIALPVLIEEQAVNARVDAGVSLDDKHTRGIHMSRLYLITQDVLSKEDLQLGLLGKATDEFLKTHLELSTQAYVQVQFEAPMIRKALKSSNQAWRSYPVILSTKNIEGNKKYYVEAVVTYSSTCPASAALSRQLIQDNFKQQFAAEKPVDFDVIHSWLGTTQGIIATPHAQRSFARVKVQVDANYFYGDLINVVEDALKTAVQGAVKREDEQEFALRNGQNLMFCEDAARNVKVALDAQKGILDYVAEFSHVESLHPHNAVSMISKGGELKAF